MTTYVIKITELYGCKELVHTYSFTNFDKAYKVFKQESYNAQRRLCELQAEDKLYHAFVELDEWRNGEYIEPLAAYCVS